jgi:hypothetical protein
MKQKLIMESWRRFLKEEDERGERLDPKDVCLASYITPGSDATFILYRRGAGEKVEDQFDNLSIIGSMWVESLKEEGPCLSGDNRGPAWHVKAVHTAPSHRRVGYSDELYGFAFLIAKQNNAALTSDKHAGTKPKAMMKWKGFEKNTSTYEKASTNEPYGSTEFDYDSSTPDPNDDCATIIVGDDPDNGTDSAFIHKNPEVYEKLMVFYEDNHQQFLSELLPTEWVTEREFTIELAEKEDDSFNNAFPEEK